MRIRSRVTTAGLLLACCSMATPALAGREGWKDIADVGQVGLVTLAFGTSVVERDWAGARQLTYSLAVTEGVTQGLNAIVHETRPDHSDDRSFPSGHTSTSFAAAGYLHQRYGWRYGLPATLAATLVGVARVESKDHHWHDVVAGAAIGELSAFLLTKPRDNDVLILPWGDGHAAGLTLHARF